MSFKIDSQYQPAGDQPKAINQIYDYLNSDVRAVTLLGVTGSGKTFTMANVIEKLQKPALILSHNKTLAAQLYAEFKAFFPNNAVEYFVSYYDYYQPEAYLPVTDTYIEKDLSINEEIDKLRISASSTLLSGRKDVIVISSVSCLYGIGNPQDFHENTHEIYCGQTISRSKFLYNLVDALYSRNDLEFTRGTFRVKGDSVDIFLAYGDYGCRIIFWGDEVESIELFDPVSGSIIEEKDRVFIYPAKNFCTTKERTIAAIKDIQDDLQIQYEFLKSIGKHLEANRLKKRVEYDMEMIKEIGYCSGIENYSRYFDKRNAGERPFCLIDYFPKDFVTFIDESHVTIPQVRAMYGGDRSRKETLIDYGFRLPAAADNRPLKFEEFEDIIQKRVFVSATPSEYELNESAGIIVEQVVRPTGLLDPKIEVRPSKNQIDDLLDEILIRVEKDERILITTLTKRMAEELEKFLTYRQVRTRYIHSDVDTLERIEIIEDFKAGRFDVLVGVNLLREGLDIPTVSLVAIIDADKEGFLRSERALTQTAGRAARNLNGLVIMYADTITNSMQRTIDETNRRRKIQNDYNIKNNISPKQIKSETKNILVPQKSYSKQEDSILNSFEEDIQISLMSPKELSYAIAEAKRKMEEAAKIQDFINAAKYRDEMNALKNFGKNKTVE